MTTLETESRIYISEASEMLDREPHTIRTWEYHNMLPEALKPHRDERGWRYWTSEQIQAIKDWLVDSDIRPGSGLPGYKPTPAQVDSHRNAIRASRRSRDTEQV